MIHDDPDHENGGLARVPRQPTPAARVFRIKSRDECPAGVPGASYLWLHSKIALSEKKTIAMAGGTHMIAPMRPTTFAWRNSSADERPKCREPLAVRARVCGERCARVRATAGIRAGKRAGVGVGERAHSECVPPAAGRETTSQSRRAAPAPSSPESRRSWHARGRRCATRRRRRRGRLARRSGPGAGRRPPSGCLA